MTNWQCCVQRVLSRFDLSEGELAQCLKTSPRTVNRWMRGETEPVGLHADVLNALSAASGVSLPFINTSATWAHLCEKGFRMTMPRLTRRRHRRRRPKPLHLSIGWMLLDALNLRKPSEVSK